MESLEQFSIFMCFALTFWDNCTSDPVVCILLKLYHTRLHLELRILTGIYTFSNERTKDFNDKNKKLDIPIGISGKRQIVITRLYYNCQINYFGLPW